MISDEDYNIICHILSPGVQGNDLVGFVDAFGQRLFEELDYVPCRRPEWWMTTHDTVMTHEDLVTRKWGNGGVWK